MLFAASESAVTKKPRLRLTMRRSSSVSPFGDFHISMSRLMLISCGIQWFAQPARYFSHAHLYLKGTSWLTSVVPLMIRLSATRTRPLVEAGSRTCALGDAPAAGGTGMRMGSAVSSKLNIFTPLFHCRSAAYWHASHSSNPSSPGRMVHTAPMTSASGNWIGAEADRPPDWLLLDTAF